MYQHLEDTDDNEDVFCIIVDIMDQMHVNTKYFGGKPHSIDYSFNVPFILREVVLLETVSTTTFSSYSFL